MTIVAGSIEEALACAALFGRVSFSAAQMHDLETAQHIAEGWSDLLPLPMSLLVEAARAFVTQASDREAPPEIVAMDILEHRRTTHRGLYGWPFVDAETIDAMAVRAARVWRDREGE